MKSFKEFLKENTTKISPTDEKKEKTAQDLVKAGLATELMGQAQFGTNAGFDTAYAIGGLYNIPPEKTRINTEQLYGTDTGLMFDYNPDSGEVEANPAGFKAVHKRESEGRSYPTVYPQGKMTADEFSQQYRDQLWKETKAIFDPETYKKLGKMVVDTFSK